MPPLRTLGALWPLTLAACAPTIPWPPKDGSCVEAYKPPGRHSARQFWINGRRSDSEAVARLVYDTPALRAKARRYAALTTATPIVVPTGHVLGLSGLMVAGIKNQPLYSLLSVSGFAAVLTVLILNLTTHDPLLTAVVAYNEKARRQGFCSAEPRPLPAPAPYEVPAELPAETGPRAAPPESLPELPQRGWTP